MSRSTTASTVTAPSALTCLLGVRSPHAMPAVVVGPTGVSPDAAASIRSAIASGGSAMIAIASDAPDGALDPVRDLVGRVELGEERRVPAATDPLLADSTCTATTTDGLTLHLERVRPLTPGPHDTVLAHLADGAPVAVGRPAGAGRLVIAGSASLLEARWLTAADNATAVARWLGVPDAAVAVRALDALSSPAPPPSPVPVVVAPDGWLDPEVVRTTSSGQLVRVAGHLNRLLPAAVHDALVDFADRPPRSGALLLRNMPIGDVPSTPPTPVSPTTKDATSELCLLTVARRLGQPVGYLPEHGGMVFQNILPTQAALDRQVSTSSNVELMFHTEAAFHPHRPRFLLLLCLRGDPAARTTLCSINDLLPAIPLRVRRVLCERRFRTAADESYVGRRPTQLGVPMAVLGGDWDSPTMVFDADLMVGTDREADDALRHLAALVDEHHHGVVLEPGDLLVVDNSVAVHGRSPFRARFDGSDRWLQRSFVIGDLGASAGERRDRVITTRFAV